MKNRRMLQRGIWVAAGILLGYAVLLPLISEKTFGEGLIEGLVGAVLAVLLFGMLDVLWPGKQDRSDEES